VATDEDRVHNEAKLRAYRKRLRVLEIRAIKQGDQVDPSVLTEIEDIRPEVARLEARIAGLDMLAIQAPPPEMRQELRDKYKDYEDLIIAMLGSLNRRMTDFEGQIVAIAGQRHAEQAWRMGITEDMQGLKVAQTKNDHDRKRGQRRNLALFLVVIVLLVPLVLRLLM
jgi:hypothetical protein